MSGADQFVRHLRHDLFRRVRVDPLQRVDDGVGQRLRLLRILRDPVRLGVERAARILAAEHVERVLLRAGVAQDAQILVLALQQRDRRIEHDRGIDRALLHRGDRGGAEADADHADRVRIDAVLLQHDTSGRNRSTSRAR